MGIEQLTAEFNYCFKVFKGCEQDLKINIVTKTPEERINYFQQTIAYGRKAFELAGALGDSQSTEYLKISLIFYEKLLEEYSHKLELLKN